MNFRTQCLSNRCVIYCLLLKCIFFLFKINNILLLFWLRSHFQFWFWMDVYFSSLSKFMNITNNTSYFQWLIIFRHIFQLVEQNIGRIAYHITLWYLSDELVIILVPFVINVVEAKSCIMSIAQASIVQDNSLKIVNHISWSILSSIPYYMTIQV